MRSRAIAAIVLTVARVCGVAPSHAATLQPDRSRLLEEARSILGPDQGVYVETSRGEVLASQAAVRPVHPASVSKIPTTLALLRRLGPGYRFTTTFAAGGAVTGATLQADLLVHSDGDPAFVDENALLVADRLRELGVTQVAGAVRLLSPFTFDWQADDHGARLQQALSGAVSSAALAAVRTFELETPGTARVTDLRAQGLQFLATSVLPPTPAAGRLLLVHRSQTLLELAKSLNDYSNNIFAPLAARAGGAEAVEALARAVVPAQMRSEITLGDGAGADPRNRLSPRAAVALLRVLDSELQRAGHHLYDILPVSGLDLGTLHNRLNSSREIGRIVGKTGTFGSYGASALAGAVNTSDQGTVYFAILNHGVPVPEARRRQDRFVAALLTHLRSVPWDYRVDPRPAIARVQITAAP